MTPRIILGGLILVAATSAAAFQAARPDTDMQGVLDELKALGGKPVETLTAAEARKQPTPADAVTSYLRKHGKPADPEPVGKVEDRMIAGAAGQIPARVYTPKGNGPFPVLVYFHGGGWVIGSAAVYDATPRALANLAACVVISVDYRLGPEHKFPAAHDDAAAAYEWVLKNAGAINGNPRQVAVGGESAGGNLAVTVAMAARDRGWQAPKHVLSVYPIAGGDTNTPSYRENAAAKPLNKLMMEWFFNHYLRTSADRKDPRVDLVHANLKGLPPTTVVTAQIDPLRSEGQALAERLRAASVPVSVHHYDGVTHEFFGMGAAVRKAKEAEATAASELKQSYAK